MERKKDREKVISPAVRYKFANPEKFRMGKRKDYFVNQREIQMEDRRSYKKDGL